MLTYTCETCGKGTEIEEYEAVLGDAEHYEFEQCLECFEQENKL